MIPHRLICRQGKAWEAHYCYRPNPYHCCHENLCPRALCSSAKPSDCKVQFHNQGKVN